MMEGGRGQGPAWGMCQQHSGATEMLHGMQTLS